MATRTSNTLLADNSTDAHFQAWAQFIEDTLVTTGGWVYVSQTGDTSPSSLAHPTTANTKKGFRVYRMADTLQGTYPVYIRIDWGSGALANTPGFWTTIGTGADGSGGITGKLYDGGAVSTPIVEGGSNSSSQANNSYGSADTNRASIALFINGISQLYPLVWAIERTKDANGSDTGDGLLLCYKQRPGGSNNTVNISQYLIWAGGSQPTIETGFQYILTAQNPSQTFGGTLGVGLISHIKGTAQQPGANLVVVNSSDFGAESQFTMSLYGTSHTYQHLNGTGVWNARAGAQDTTSRVAIRYD